MLFMAVLLRQVSIALWPADRTIKYTDKDEGGFPCI